MARKRDWKKEYVRRSELARAKGYESYYDYRLHLYGKLQPGTPRVKGPRKERAIGRRGPQRLYSHMEEGRVELINLNVARYGKKPEFDIQVTLDDGSTEEFQLKGRDQIDTFRDLIYEYDIEEPVGSPRAIAAAGFSV